MGFWIFMLIMNLLIPATMVGFGAYFRKYAPKRINYFFGYRTTMSMKNINTWEFAHHHCGKIWWNLGWPMIAITIIVMLFFIGNTRDTVENVSISLCIIWCIVLMGSIIPTEIALRKTFDKNGNPR